MNLVDTVLVTMGIAGVLVIGFGVILMGQTPIFNVPVPGRKKQAKAQKRN